VAAGFEFEQNGKPTFDTTPPLPLDQLFTFFDNAYKLFPIDGCTVSITANEVPPAEICERIRKIEYDPVIANDPSNPAQDADYFNVPPCLSAGDDPQNPVPNGIKLDPVIYLGNTFPELYRITEETGDCSPGPNGINHIISAFTQQLRTPQLAFCSDETTCGLTPLNFVAPNDGAFPRDGSFGGFSPGLSEWFLVDDQFNPLVPTDACLCPIQPLPEGETPEFSQGDTIPLRTKLLDNTSDPIDCSNRDALEQACQTNSAGEYITDPETKLLLSLARVKDGSTEVFEPVIIEAAGNDQEQPPYFSPPNSINAAWYSYQLTAPLGRPGLYKAIIFVVNRNLQFPEEGYVERLLEIQ
jgi:hypothetical protein